MCHPFGSGFVHQVVIKELLHSDGEVFPVGEFSQSMFFSRIGKQYHIFVKKSESVVKLQIFHKGHCWIIRAVEKQQRNIHRLHMGNRRLIPIGFKIIMRIGPPSSLSVVVVSVTIRTVPAFDLVIPSPEMIEIRHKIRNTSA